MSETPRSDPFVRDMRAAAERCDDILQRHAARIRAALAEWSRQWPPERIIASIIAEHNRRMDEFNGRTRHE